MGLIDEFFQGFQKFFDKNSDALINSIVSYFDTPFFHMIGYTGIAAFTCGALAYFFPNLRAFAGAVFFSLFAMWYGFYEGKHGEDGLKTKLKSKR